MATTDRARWEEHFAAVIVTGNRGEIEAATLGALAALHGGADDATAKQAGREALRRYRAERAERADAPARDDPGDDPFGVPYDDRHDDPVVGGHDGRPHLPLLRRLRWTGPGGSMIHR